MREPTLLYIQGWLVNHPYWPSCPACSFVFSGFSFFFINFQIISSDVFFITSRIWSLILCYFASPASMMELSGLWYSLAFGLKYILLSYRMSLVWWILFVLGFNMRYTSDPLLVFYPTKIQVVPRSAILVDSIILVFSTPYSCHVCNADAYLGTDPIQWSQWVAFFPLCLITTNPPICISVIIASLQNL